MARSLRIQYPGALYSVCDRGNYRQPIFATVGAAKSFLDTLEEAGARYRWRLFAYVLMSNHFHLVVETPQPNLVDGMHWLLATYAIRFNRSRQEQGHLFQGRYHAGIIEDFRQLGHVVDYVHLNPVQAKIVEASMAHCYRWSSLAGFISSQRLRGLVAIDWLSTHGLADTPEGWKRYRDHLEELSGNLELQKAHGWDGFTRGWAIGALSWKRTLARRFDRKKLTEGIDPLEVQAVKEAEWEHAMAVHLAAYGKSEQDCVRERKHAAWKLRIALELRENHAASISWISRRLRMGADGSARSALSRFSKINNTRPDPIQVEDSNQRVSI